MSAMIQCLAAKPKVSALMLNSFIIVRNLSFEWLSIQTWSVHNRKHGWYCSSFSMCSSSLTHSGKCKEGSLVCSTFIRHADYPCNLLYFTFCVVHLPGTNINSKLHQVSVHDIVREELCEQMSAGFLESTLFCTWSSLSRIHPEMLDV